MFGNAASCKIWVASRQTGTRFNLVSLCIVDGLMQKKYQNTSSLMSLIGGVYVTIGMFENFWIHYKMLRNQI